jgi:quercetin dioxygenase-like cupin family protein
MMKTQESQCPPSEGAVHLSRLPKLGSAVLQFDLSKEIEELRKEDSWQRETGRSSKTLVKQQDFRIVVVLMKANTRMTEHRAEARTSIHALSGRIRVHLEGHAMVMTAGQLLALDCGVRHDVESLEESAFLLTISWPKEYATWTTDDAAHTVK